MRRLNFAAYAAAFASAMRVMDVAARGAFLADLGSYRSRGKGRSYNKREKLSTHSSTYFPPEARNGARECARRLRQSARQLQHFASDSRGAV